MYRLERHAAVRLPLCALLVLLAVVGCDDDDGPTAPPLDTAMTWVLLDDCDDGFGLQARFFDFTFDRVYPSNTSVYFTDPGGEIDVTLDCPSGAQICYGATTDPQTNFFWGVDIDGNAGCDDCCEVCQPVTVEFSLTCAARQSRV